MNLAKRKFHLQRNHCSGVISSYYRSSRTMSAKPHPELVFLGKLCKYHHSDKIAENDAKLCSQPPPSKHNVFASARNTHLILPIKNSLSYAKSFASQSETNFFASSRMKNILKPNNYLDFNQTLESRKSNDTDDVLMQVTRIIYRPEPLSPRLLHAETATSPLVPFQPTQQYHDNSFLWIYDNSFIIFDDGEV
jgi:hypothetical protein